MSRGPASLRGSGLKVHFDGVKAVDGVDVCVAPGEILGVIGPNGAGKTTLVNTLTGFQKLTAGTLHLGDRDITGWAPESLPRLGIARTFQSLRSFGGLTVNENIEVAALAVGKSRKAARQRATHLLALMELSDLADQRANDLPFGHERRLEIARAAATDPSFLVLDEPAAGLNDAESRGLIDMIRRVHDESNCGVLLIEHDMGVVMTLSDRVQVLNFGQTLATGTPAEIQCDDAVLTAYLGRQISAA